MKRGHEKVCILTIVLLALGVEAQGQSAGLGSSAGLSSTPGSGDALLFHATPRGQRLSPLLDFRPRSPQEGSATTASDEAAANSPGMGKVVLEGEVKNPSGGALPGAVVTLKAPSGRSRAGLTDSDGKFRISKRPGAAPGESRAADDDRDARDLWKKKIEGKVTGASGDSLAGVLVSVDLSQSRSKTAVTDARGNFRINEIKWNDVQTGSLGRRRAETGKTASASFWALQGLMFGSAIGAVESTHNCIQSGSCTAVPSMFRTRAAMYNAGLPVTAGIAILSYEMKKHGNRWWLLPPAIVTGADGLLTFHSARASR
jgi:hypothetical protein